MASKTTEIGLNTYAKVALPHLEEVLKKNTSVMEDLVAQLVQSVLSQKCLFVFGSGHSSIFTMELYHRAGGPSFVIPLVADYFLPSAGPTVVRMMERTVGSARFLLDRAQPQEGEMLWLASQSGINSAAIDLALEAKNRKLRTVAFTSLPHSQSVASRHPSGKRLFEVCDQVVDLGGVAGDAAVPISNSLSAGPLSSLTTIFLAHSILTVAMAKLEDKGHHCVYTSINTKEGEARNQKLEEVAKKRDPLLR